MLVLSRKKNEQILVGDDVVITIVEIRGDKVRLGIAAPKNVPVHRREVYDAIARANAAVVQPSQNQTAAAQLQSQSRIKDEQEKPGAKRA